jgi:hypothetical protein
MTGPGIPLLRKGQLGVSIQDLPLITGGNTFPAQLGTDRSHGHHRTLKKDRRVRVAKSRLALPTHEVVTRMPLAAALSCMTPARAVTDS